ncbi:MAG: OmpA family protein [Bacteroidaceae bacterium]|nr:OmpA family protein [Bacteroidaceae bacterium]
MKIHNYIYISLFFLLLGSIASCGGVDKTLKRGDAAMAIGEYCEAAAQYRKAYSRTPSKEREQRGIVAYKMGDAYRRYGNSARALGAFRNAARYGQADTLTHYYIGELLRMNGDYAGAEKAYLQYLEKFPQDLPAKRGYLACQDALAVKKKGSAYTVKIENLFNGNRSDYSPAFLGEDGAPLYFTTNRQTVTGSELSSITGLKNSDIFFAKKDEKGKWKLPEALDANINTEDDEGAPAFSPDGKTMFLTLCRKDPQYPRMAEIWKAQRTDATWSKPEQVKLTADTLSSYAHPAISPDGSWIYFTSDMPGGYGGMDLWRARYDGKGVGAVENLGADINTSADEVFPTFRPNGMLYFSSAGRLPSLGGLDIYHAVEDTLTHRWTVVHLPAPVNSQGDDFGMTFEGLHNRGYFSSNRSTGGRGWDKIYSFSYPEVLQTVQGWVYEQDGYELPEAQVYMIGDDGTNVKLSVRSDGSFEQPVTPGVRYLFLATCQGYLNARADLTADTLEVEHRHVLQFPLPSTNVPVLVRNVFYEFDSAELTPESTEALDRLANMLKEHPNITIELSAHCDYRGNDKYNLNLSQRRAESVVKYLTKQGIQSDRLTPKGYGETLPKRVNKKLLEQHPFLHENDTLSEAYILALPADQQEACNALNRRTEFRVLRTTYGMFDDVQVKSVGAEANREEE